MKPSSKETTISIMSEDDVSFTTELTDIEKWGNLQEDFRRLMHLEPEGCFVASRDNEKVGMITTTSYRDYAFIGSLIVRQEWRGRGIGELLMTHAIDYLRGKGVRSIELDGVFAALSLYRRLGFKDKYLSFRFIRLPKVIENPVTDPNIAVPGDLCTYDESVTGIHRQRVLKRFVEEFTDGLLVIGKDSPSAYAFVRPQAEGYLTIGPFIAECDDTAEHLLLQILAKYSRHPLNVGVPEIKRSMVNLLLRHGFMYDTPSLRMYLGERKDYEKHVYGILSPEKG